MFSKTISHALRQTCRKTISSSQTCIPSALTALTARLFSTRHKPKQSSLSSSSSSPLSPFTPPARHTYPICSSSSFLLSFARPRRTLFIQTKSTPNPDALKFLPGTRVLPLSIPSIEYLSGRTSHSSPLARKLFALDGTFSIFYGPDFITVTKTPDANWAHLKPEVFSLITEAITSGEPIVVLDDEGKVIGGEGGHEDTKIEESDTEVVSMIKELLDTRIRPTIQEDGGDIEYRGFNPETGEVLLKLRGACKTCDSSTITLKNGIESMLMHYIEEVKKVTQVVDQEEEIARQEFERFEQRLREAQTRGGGLGRV